MGAKLSCKPFENAASAAHAGSLANYTRPELIISQLQERDAAGIIGELSQVLRQQDCVPDVLPFYQAALNQDLLSNSSTGFGIAIAHARLNGVRQLQFALGRTQQPVIWGSKGWPVRLVFLIAVPATDAVCYLHLLSSLARLGQQPDILAKILFVPTIPDVLSVLGEVEVRSA